MKIQFISFLILAISALILTPIQHLLLVLGLGVTAWLRYPKDVLNTSYMICLSLVIFGHLPVIESLSLLFSHPVLLLVVGCIMANILVKNGLHQVLADRLMYAFQPKSELSLVLLMFGIAGFLSMWMSNTSVVAMLIPVVMTFEGVVVRVDRLLLSIAYGATIGGMLTPIGTPANLVAIAYAERYFNIVIDFAAWFQYALPFVILLFFGLSLYFYFICQRTSLTYRIESKSIMTSQAVLMSLLGGCVLLWATRSLPFGGWGQFLPFVIKEEWIGVMVIFFCSQVRIHEKKAFCLRDLTHLPFSSIWMVIAGLFMAEGMVRYHVVSLVLDFVATGSLLASYQALFLFGFVVNMITEICSNTAVTSLSLPLSEMMIQLSSLEALPSILLITFSANSAFMLPTATPPNALILGTGKLAPAYLVMTGLIMSMLSLVILVCMLLVI